MKARRFTSPGAGFAWAAILGSLIASNAAAATADKVSVAVMDLKGSDTIPAQLVSSLTSLIPEELDRMGVFKTITTADIRQMLSLESMKDSLGCDDVSCLAEIGGALGVDYMITGSVTLVGDVFLVQLQLANSREPKVENRVAREYRGGPTGLLDEMRTASKILVRTLLADRSGQLRFAVSEEGATVRLDGVIVGTSPLAAPLTVGGGVHTAGVEKEGFIRFQADVEVKANETVTVTADLRPSQEFLKSYQSAAGTRRWIAWGVLGGGAAMLVTAGVLVGVSADKSAALTERINAYNASDLNPDEYDIIQRENRSIGSMDLSFVILGVAGAAAVTTGLVLWLAGDDPDRYEAQTEVGTPQVGLMPWLGGLAFTGQF